MADAVLQTVFVGEHHVRVGVAIERGDNLVKSTLGEDIVMVKQGDILALRQFQCRVGSG